MVKNAKASVTIGDTTITFEGPAEFVDQQISKYTATNIARQGIQGYMREAGAPSTQAIPPAERSLIAEKKPRNHPETVAVLAFALAEGGVEEFTEDDMRRAYLRGGVRPPKVISQAVRDAKNNYDFIEAGTQRGCYRLTNHGDRTVRFDLPAPRG
jgi:hypothetical protein